MSPKATIDGRTLMFDGERMALDHVSEVVAIDRTVTDYQRDWAKSVDWALNVATFALFAWSIWQLFTGTWSWFALLLSMTALCLVATTLFPRWLTHVGLARQQQLHTIRLDYAGDEIPTRLAETPDKAFRDRVAATLRDIVAHRRAAYHGIIDFHRAEITVVEAGAAPVQRPAPPPSGADDVRIIDGHLVLAEQVVALRLIESFEAETSDAVYDNVQPQILLWGGIAALILAPFQPYGSSWQMLAVLAAIALGASLLARLISGAARLVRPARTTVSAELKSGTTLPLFTTEDGDFANRVAQRLNHLLTSDIPNGAQIVIDWRKGAIGGATGAVS